MAPVIAVSGASRCLYRTGPAARAAKRRAKRVSSAAQRDTSGRSTRSRDPVRGGFGPQIAGEPVRLVRDLEDLPSAGAVHVACRRHSGSPTSALIHALLDLESRLDLRRGRARLVSARGSFRARVQHLCCTCILEIENETLKGPTHGQAYSDTLTAKQVVTLNPPTGTVVQAQWSCRARGHFCW